MVHSLCSTRWRWLAINASINHSVIHTSHLLCITPCPLLGAAVIFRECILMGEWQQRKSLLSFSACKSRSIHRCQLLPSLLSFMQSELWMRRNRASAQKHITNDKLIDIAGWHGQRQQRKNCSFHFPHTWAQRSNERLFVAALQRIGCTPELKRPQNSVRWFLSPPLSLSISLDSSHLAAKWIQPNAISRFYQIEAIVTAFVITWIVWSQYCWPSIFLHKYMVEPVWFEGRCHRMKLATTLRFATQGMMILGLT